MSDTDGSSGDTQVDRVVFERSADHFISAFPKFSEFRCDGTLCDVTLKVDGGEINAHKVVLAGTIPYFQAMFSHNLAEINQKDIEIKGLDYRYDTMHHLLLPCLYHIVLLCIALYLPLLPRTILYYLYLISFFAPYLHPSLYHHTILSTVYLYLYFYLCLYFLLPHIPFFHLLSPSTHRFSPSTILSTLSFASSLSLPDLAQAATLYIYSHFPEVSLEPHFLTLSVEELAKIIDSDELNVKTEEVVFEAVMRWVNKDLSRTSLLPALLCKVRLPLLTPQYITDHVITQQAIKSSHQCRDLVDEAKDYHLMPERRSLLNTSRTRPRACGDAVGLIYAVGGLASSGDSLSTVEMYDPTSQRWTLTEPMDSLRSRVGVAVLDGNVYAIGGYNGVERLNTVEVYNPRDGHWSRVAPMASKRSALASSPLHSFLYVCGGYDGVTSLSSVEYYSPHTNTWSPAGPMSRHRSAAGVTLYHGDLYSLGGHDGMSIFDSVEMYCPPRDLWLPSQAMTTKRCRLGVAPLRGRLYACGGYDGNSFLCSCEAYDARQGKWVAVAEMQTKRSRVAVVQTGGRLYAVGGYDGVANLSSVEVYDPRADKWEYTQAMIAHVGGVGVGVVPCAS